MIQLNYRPTNVKKVKEYSFSCSSGFLKVNILTYFIFSLRKIVFRIFCTITKKTTDQNMEIEKLHDQLLTAKKKKIQQ